jgi:hypothetical protein
MLNGFYIIWPFILKKKYRRFLSELKLIFLKLSAKGIKSSTICTDFKKVHNSRIENPPKISP